MLGVSVGGGRRRSVAVLKGRLKVTRGRIPRVRQLRRMGLSAVEHTRAAGVPAMLYGVEVTGISDTMLQQARAAAAHACAPAAAGKNPAMVLHAVSVHTPAVDPAYIAHTAPIKSWALAWWEGWVP